MVAVIGALLILAFQADRSGMNGPSKGALQWFGLCICAALVALVFALTVNAQQRAVAAEQATRDVRASAIHRIDLLTAENSRLQEQTRDLAERLGQMQGVKP